MTAQTEALCERSDCNPETCAHSSHRKVSGDGWGHPSTWPTSEDWAAFWGEAQGDPPLCPEDLTPLLFSEEQAPCIYSLIDADHGQQDWWDCPHCGAVWETAECDPEREWRCRSWEAVAS